jgi:predicted nucleic acid-binding protein
VYVDSSILIYSVETHAEYWPLLKPLWQTAQTGSIALVTSELAIMEALVGPLRRGDVLLTGAYDDLFEGAELRLLPMGQSVVRKAAQLRADLPALRTPDALHAATALLAACTMFLTNDSGFRRVGGLPVVVLDDVARA